MKFVICLSVFIALVGVSAFCQEVKSSQESDKKLAVKSGVEASKAARNIKSTKQRGANCLCPGKNRAVKGCQCKMQNALTQEEKTLCVTNGILKYKKCKAVVHHLMNMKGKKKVIITPF